MSSGTPTPRPVEPSTISTINGTLANSGGAIPKSKIRLTQTEMKDLISNSMLVGSRAHKRKLETKYSKNCDE